MKKELLLAITAICSIVMITACATEDNPPVWEGKTTSLFVASARFAAWADTLSGHDPIIVMSHVPIHASRNDNTGGLRWFNTLSRAAQKHDNVLLFGHNHTLEERGNSSDSGMYLLAPGDSITVQGDSVQGAQRHR